MLPPVIIVDDDEDEHDLMKEVWKELKVDYPLISFFTGKQLLDYLHADKPIPFLIISDINLPVMNDFQLREKILSNDSSKFKGIPLIFWSGTATESQIKQAYDLSSHGFFIKTPAFKELQEIVKDIIAYWQKSEPPKFTD